MYDNKEAIKGGSRVEGESKFFFQIFLYKGTEHTILTVFQYHRTDLVNFLKNCYFYNYLTETIKNDTYLNLVSQLGLNYKYTEKIFINN